MEPTPSKSADHTRFDELCAEIEDFEPLPAVVTKPAEGAASETEDDRTTPLDGLILAGLVSP